MYVGTEYCETTSTTLLMMWFANPSEERVARERHEQVACPGTESKALREFRQIADEAGCAVLKEGS